MRMKQFTYEFFQKHEPIIECQLSYQHGSESLLYQWNPIDPRYSSIQRLLGNRSPDPSLICTDSTKSGGVHSLVRAYLSRIYGINPKDLLAIPIQKDFLFVPSIEKKYRISSHLVAMSHMHDPSRGQHIFNSFLRLLFGARASRWVLPDLIHAPHPVHWLCTERYQKFLPDLWRDGKICLVFLPKSTFVVRREISPLALEAIVASIRQEGMVPVACIYPDQYSLLSYHSIFRIGDLFDDIVVAGPVTSLCQMITLLTYIDASVQVCVPETEDDLIGPLSTAAILGIYRGKYAAIRKEDIHIYVNRSPAKLKQLQRYPSKYEISRIKQLSNALSSAVSADEQYDLLMRSHCLDVLPNPQHTRL